MKKLQSLPLAGSALALMLAAIAPAAPAADMTAPASRESGAVVDGTIPAARPGLPEAGRRGAQGPLRSDTTDRQGTDPSIRDNDPLTANGLWETLPGNRVETPRPE